MDDPHNIQKEVSSTNNQVPLIDPKQNIVVIVEENEEELSDTILDQKLQRLENFLWFFGFQQSSLLGFIISWVAFLVIGILVPVLILLLPSCSDCEKYQINRFELNILASQACLAAISLLCISHNLRKYGVRRFLFVDRYQGHMVRFRKEYIELIQGFFRLLVFLILPCFILKTVREVFRIKYMDHESWWVSVAMLSALIFSWSYSTVISLSASFLFNLMCNLQVIYFDDYEKLLESDSDVSAFIEEHIRLRHYLSKISHRFRIFLLLEFLVVTSSQFMTLFQTTGYHGIITFTNGGDFAVSSIVQVVGISVCLHAASKISHKAQRVASIASRWHALVTCNSSLRGSNSVNNFEATANSMASSIPTNFSESDLESLDSVGPPPNYTRLASHAASYNKRQAFVMYLQSNPGGVTIYGRTVDRGLINTLFFIELSLVLFLLGKTIVFTNK